MNVCNVNAHAISAYDLCCTKRTRERGKWRERKIDCYRRREMIRPCHKLNKWTFSWLSLKFLLSFHCCWSIHYVQTLFIYFLAIFIFSKLFQTKEREWFVVDCCHPFVFLNSILLKNIPFVFWKKKLELAEYNVIIGQVAGIHWSLYFQQANENIIFCH